MPAPYQFPEFRAETAHSVYPFADGASLADATGAVVLPYGAVVDAVLYPAGGDGTLALRQVVVAPRAVTFRVGTQAAPALCAGTFDPLALTGSIGLVDPAGRPAGLLVVDTTLLAVAAAWGPGTYALLAPFSPAVQVPVPVAGLQGIVVDGTVFAGEVWMVGEDGVAVYEAADPGVIRIDAVGDPLFARRACADPDGTFVVPNFLRTINGNGPDAHGGFRLEADDLGTPDTVLRITPRDGKVALAAAAPDLP
jgi:hypothetical protein